MKNILNILLVFVLMSNVIAQEDYTQFVNPFIGTGGHGHTYPGAAFPFGMMQLSPDTRLSGWDGCSGYHYSDSILYGFSHTHLSGTGVSDYGDLLLMPYDPALMRKNDAGQVISRFSHKNETASPGYYAVHLDDGNIDAEFTLTKRTGMHHYTYHNNAPALVIDLNHRDALIAYEIAPVSATKLVGKRISKAWAKEQYFYFVIEFSQPFTIRKTELNGKRLYLTFNQSNELFVKVGMSATDLAGAKNNLAQEIPHWNFNQIHERAKQSWNKELGKIQIFSNDENFKTSYYTALYHSFLNPNLFSDVDGRYRGMDNQIHQSNDEQYTVFSLWDTFRALHPLFTIVQQAKTNKFIRTFLRQYQEGGSLPVWELAANETNCMIGYHAVSVIADAFAKGINDFDTALALQAMISIAQKDELGKKAFHTLGYIPVEEEHESVSKTLEYAYDDWCIASYAKSIGENDIAQQYFEYAQYYKNCFNPKNGFMQAKIHNAFQTPFDPKEVNFNYTEANAWQYSFFVPQDIAFWIGLLGGDSLADAKLDQLFSATTQTTGRHQVDITGLIGQYAHGNEPSHHIAFLYNYVGKPWKTQEKTEQIINTFYHNAPNGLSGNEDCGQMSAWLNMTALGLYAVTPGLPIYNLTVPHVDSAIINLENGNHFKITTTGRNIHQQNYIQKVLLNGKEWNNAYINHKIIDAGGEIAFILGQKPGNWATKQVNRPHSSINASPIAIVPYFETKNKVFEDSLEIKIHCTLPTEQIFYTLDGTTPTKKSLRYTQPILIAKTTTIKAIAMMNNKISQVISQKFFQLNQKWDISVQSHCNPQYTAGGSSALIDKQFGGNDFRTGAWQGYQGENFKAVIDLNDTMLVKTVGANFIQEIRSWIWMPKQLFVWTSTDSLHWTMVATIDNTVAENDYNTTVQTLKQNLTTPTNARYIKFEATQYGTIPSWHLGKGGESFIFIDELIIEE